MRWLYLGAVACFVGGLAWRYGVIPFGAVTPQMPNPQDIKVTNGIVTSSYFDLSYPLPPGWTEGLAGPDPSHSGYYMLGNFIPKNELTGTILISAQDMFFAARPHSDAAAAANAFRMAMAEIEGMTIDREPLPVRLADRAAQRVDFSGVGLYRALFVAEIRCHLVSFNLTTRDRDLLARLALSLDHLSVAGAGRAASSVPVCVKDHAVDDNLLRKVEPTMVAPAVTPIPARIIIGTDGSVKHVHVVRATPAQRQSIEDALRQWKFRPYAIKGRPVEIETGVVFQSGQKE